MKANTEKPYKRKTSITLDEDLYHSLSDLAEEDGRTLSGYINMVLRSHVTNINLKARNSAFISGMSSGKADKVADRRLL